MKILKKFLYTSSDYYDVYEFDKFSKNTEKEIEKIEGKRVYLIDADFPGTNGATLARKIRENKDLLSPIILTTNSEKICVPEFIKNTLLLNIIYKNKDIIKELLETLKTAYKMVTQYSVLTFTSFDETYRLPYDDIYYIEKNTNDDSVTIYTKDDSYIDYVSIKKLEKILIKDPRFFKSHRSCILNLYNVLCYNHKENLVIFKNGTKTDLVCRSKKKLLKKRLAEDISYE